MSFTPTGGWPWAATKLVGVIIATGVIHWVVL